MRNLNLIQSVSFLDIQGVDGFCYLFWCFDKQKERFDIAKKNVNKKKYVALYERLSRDDELQGESNRFRS